VECGSIGFVVALFVRASEATGVRANESANEWKA
jgi:hypothetical protein